MLISIGPTYRFLQALLLSKTKDSNDVRFTYNFVLDEHAPKFSLKQNKMRTSLFFNSMNPNTVIRVDDLIHDCTFTSMGCVFSWRFEMNHIIE
jgi:hypothetical protein